MIKVMTIHGAKGLEFKHVFLVNMVDKRFPTIERKELIELPEKLIRDIKPTGDIHLQEERRICYVAMTRAKKGLYLTSAKDYGGEMKKKLSRFMVEMGYKDEVKISGPKAQDSLSELEQKPSVPAAATRDRDYLPGHFSFSQLAAFEKCPLQYKFAFILKVPTRGKAVFSFGKTMHNTLYQFLKNVNEGSAKKQSNLFGTHNETPRFTRGELNDLIQIYEKNWIDEWYENKKQKEEYYKLGKRIIKDFYGEFSNPPAGGPPKIMKINNALALEMPFNLKIGEHTLYGVIDRIDDREEGAAIIDYKTGNSKEKLAMDDKEQLLIYQIAAEEIFRIQPKELIYYYLNDNRKASFLGSEKEKKQLKEKILREIEEIKTSDFEATPGWQCGFCDFKGICDYAQR